MFGRIISSITGTSPVIETTSTEQPKVKTKKTKTNKSDAAVDAHAPPREKKPKEDKEDKPIKAKKLTKKQEIEKLKQEAAEQQRQSDYIKEQLEILVKDIETIFQNKDSPDALLETYEPLFTEYHSELIAEVERQLIPIHQKLNDDKQKIDAFFIKSFQKLPLIMDL